MISSKSTIIESEISKENPNKWAIVDINTILGNPNNDTLSNLKRLNLYLRYFKMGQKIRAEELERQRQLESYIPEHGGNSLGRK